MVSGSCSFISGSPAVPGTVPGELWKFLELVRTSFLLSLPFTNFDPETFPELLQLWPSSVKGEQWNPLLDLTWPQITGFLSCPAQSFCFVLETTLDSEFQALPKYFSILSSVKN